MCCTRPPPAEASTTEIAIREQQLWQRSSVENKHASFPEIVKVWNHFTLLLGLLGTGSCHDAIQVNDKSLDNNQSTKHVYIPGLALFFATPVFSHRDFRGYSIPRSSCTES